jgi:hypothetical protein
MTDALDYEVTDEMVDTFFRKWTDVNTRAALRAALAVSPLVARVKELEAENERLRASCEGFRPCVTESNLIGLTEMLLEDCFVAWHPWTANGTIKGHAVDLGYDQAGHLVGIKIWDQVAVKKEGSCLSLKIGGVDQ